MRSRCVISAIALLGWALPCAAEQFGPYEVTLQGDLRVVAASTPYEASAYGGVGTTRFDEIHDGVRLGRFMIDVNGPLTETLRALMTFSATNDGDAHALDVTEAFVEWRPYPRGPWRFRTRVGAFYPSISLEHRSIGWESLYSLTPSALNSWLGEELRAIGVETSATLVGAPDGRSYDVSLIAGVYGWNDPLGILIYQRGWALTDRQTTLFGGLPRPLHFSAHDARIEFFREIDDRPGIYVGAEWKRGGQVVRALRYDNRGDPAISAGKDSAWLTRFDALGWRWELPTQTTLIVQGLKGDTAVGPSTDGRGMLILDYWSYFILVSQRLDAHRLSVRFDRMFTKSTRGADIFPSGQTARAWTFAYLWDLNSSWQLGAEAVRLCGTLHQRALLGVPAAATERTVQLALRYSW